jgi:hypothetical protein
MGMEFSGLKCQQGPAIVNIIAWSSADVYDPRGAMFEALNAAHVTVRQLCGHCFPVAIRKDYAILRNTPRATPRPDGPGGD